jgi:hypothetical protein
LHPYLGNIFRHISFKPKNLNGISATGTDSKNSIRLSYSFNPSLKTPFFDHILPPIILDYVHYFNNHWLPALPRTMSNPTVLQDMEGAEIKRSTTLFQCPHCRKHFTRLASHLSIGCDYAEQDNNFDEQPPLTDVNIGTSNTNSHNAEYTENNGNLDGKRKSRRKQLSHKTPHDTNGERRDDMFQDDLSLLTSDLSQFRNNPLKDSDTDTTNNTMHIPVDDPRFVKTFTATERSMMRIYDYCEFIGIQRKAQDELLEIIRQEIHNGLDLDKFPSRETFISKLEKRVHVPKPLRITVALENDSAFDLQYKRKTRDTVEVIAFDFKEQLLDLLSDTELFGNLDNLVINNDDPFGPYESSPFQLSEVHDGRWYHHTQIRCQLNGNDFLLPIVFYVDKTGTPLVNVRFDNQCVSIDNIIDGF